ncbi:class A beta-lactamase [Pontibacterium granulatum]|uniref:class A beta-lactamase n=1 Tax=Pontibacterium granulatum TaxID=2036029 RepID=UPI003CE4BA39
MFVLSAMAFSHAAQAEESFEKKIAAIENKLDGRIGLVMLNLNNGEKLAYNAHDRFPISSTFKIVLCGAILAKVDAGDESLDRHITFEKSEIVNWSPITENLFQTGMSVGELCNATMTMSDNTAANLLLATIGGPQGLTMFLRGIGDDTTRLDRWETKLNEGAPGDLRDTTTPAAALRTLKELLFGKALSVPSRRQLTKWMIDDKVADDLLRASLPEGWEIGDKSGAGGYGSRSIVAVIWPPEKGPILVTVYLTENGADFPTRNQVIAEIGAVIVEKIQSQ